MWDWPSGISVYVWVFSTRTQPFKFLWIHRLLANNMVCGVVGLGNWLAKQRSQNHTYKKLVYLVLFGTSHSTLKCPVEFPYGEHCRKLFHYKLTGPTSLTMADWSHKLDYGQTAKQAKQTIATNITVCYESMVDSVLKRGGTPILFGLLLWLTAKN